MLCSETCPRGLNNCKPLSNVVESEESGPIPNASFVCLGIHATPKRNQPGDKYRHCFRSNAGDDTDSDSMFDYNEYDIATVIAVLSEGLLVDKFLDVSPLNEENFRDDLSEIRAI